MSVHTELFESGNQTAEALQEAGGFTAFVDTLNPDQLGGIFKNINNGCVMLCIDGGCTCNSYEGELGQINLAGSGILMDSPRAVAQMLDGLDILQHIHSITSHDDCRVTVLTDEDIETWSRDLVDAANEQLELSGAGHRVEYQHIGTDAGDATRIAGKMDRPDGFHDARAVYINLSSTRLFDPGAVTDQTAGDMSFPKGFTIDYGIFGQQNAFTEVDVALGIALGDQGFGEMITSEHPLTLVVIAESSEQASEVVSALEVHINEQFPEDASRISIDTLISNHMADED